MSSAVGPAVAPPGNATPGASAGMGAEKRSHLDSNDPDEPELKRRAQNRAAQRAFRERKERHLRDLETRLAELEVESRSWKSTNLALRNQLSMLEEELHHYRQRARAQQPMPPHGMSQIPLQSAPPPHNPRTPMPPQHQAPQHHHQQQQQHHMSKQIPTPPGLNRGDSLGGSVGSTPASAITPASPPSAAGEEFCQQLSMACGTRDRPLPAMSPSEVGGFDTSAATPHQNAPPQIAAEITGWQMPQDLLGFPGKLPPSQNATNTSQSPSSSSPSNPQVQASGANDNLYIGDLVNGDYGMFDPLDDILGWDSAIGMGATGASLSPIGAVVDPVGLDALDVPSLGSTSISSPSSQAQTLLPIMPDRSRSQQSRGSPDSHGAPTPGSLSSHPQSLRGGPSPNAPPSLANSSPMSNVNTPTSISGAGGSDTVGSKEDRVASSSTRFVSCSDVWDRLCAHPRFGEIDINSMCNELRTKAKCSDSGVVMTERDLDRVLSNY